MHTFKVLQHYPFELAKFDLGHPVLYLHIWFAITTWKERVEKSLNLVENQLLLLHDTNGHAISGETSSQSSQQ